MIETSTSAAMQEAEELMNALDFDCRYGTHVRGSHVSVTVTMMPEPESGRVRGMVHCHAFGHLRPNWAEIDVFLDYGPDFGQLKFNQSGAAAFEFALSTGGDHLFHLYAVSRSRTPLVTQEMAASVADFSGKVTTPPQPVKLDFVSHAADLTPSHKFVGQELQLFFETKSASPSQQVAFWLGTVAGAKITAGRTNLALSPSQNMWRARWLGPVGIPKGVTHLRLLYWRVPSPDTAIG
jgi:hypothetical protein